MATINKRSSGSYQITVSLGYGMDGKQIRKSLTYTPEKGMTKRQIEKAVRHEAELFEEGCRTGRSLNSSMRFCDFADMWFEDREKDLRPMTYTRYQIMLPRINAAIGHMKLKDIQPLHLRAFYKNLSEGGIRKDTRYKIKIDLEKLIAEKEMSYSAFCNLSGLKNTTLIAIRRGENVRRENAEKVAQALEMSLLEIFDPLDAEKPLSAQTVLHHHRLISVILSTAVEWGLLFSNPCSRTKAPRVGELDPRYLDEVQAAELLKILDGEYPSKRTAARVLLFTGLRRGEVLGLKWSDIDFKKSIMEIKRTLQYLPDRGIFENETKTKSSNRVIKLPQTVISDLKSYKVWQIKQRLLVGDKWMESDYIFTNDFGEPLRPDSLSSWFSRLIKAHSDTLPYVTLHSLRHTNATLLIASGVPITTVSSRLGHTNSNTTGKIYAHAIRSADEAAAETLENILSPTLNRNIS